MSIHKTPSGSYRVKWRIGNKQHSKNFDRKLDAERFESKLRLGLVDVSELSRTKFKEFCEIWHRDHCLVKKAPSQWKDDRYTLDRHLIPAFGEKALRDLKLRDLITLQSELARRTTDQISPRTINKICGMARKIMADALAWDYVKSNPFVELSPIRQQTPKFDFWTREEAAQFLSATKTSNPEMHDLVAVALNTGLRVGELRGLLRDSVDFERRIITVRRSFCCRTRTLQMATKTKLVRHVPMNGIVVDILGSRANDRLEAPIFKISFENIRRKFRAACKAAEVRQIRFHDLRHTFASHLAIAGVPITTIRDLLGHTDIKMTSRYSHLVPSTLSSATDLLLLSGS